MNWQRFLTAASIVAVAFVVLAVLGDSPLMLLWGAALIVIFFLRERHEVSRRSR